MMSQSFRWLCGQGWLHFEGLFPSNLFVWILATWPYVEDTLLNTPVFGERIMKDQPNSRVMRELSYKRWTQTSL